VPELPDVVVYIEALTRHVLGRRLERLRLLSPFVLRSFDPPIDILVGRTVRGVQRVGKRIVIGFDDDLFLVIHLMIAGRLRWRAAPAAAPASGRVSATRSRRQPEGGEVRDGAQKPPGISPKMMLAAFDFPNGTLVFTEASSKKRASMRLVRGGVGVRALDPGGVEPLEANLEEFSASLTAENHTLKRALTDPRLLSGIGNAYSDEILHAAQLSPLTLTQRLTPPEWGRLYTATRETLQVWIVRLRDEAQSAFPEKVTAFRKGMAAHGRFGQPCPRCGEKVLRIRYADKETNYCARCQTGGKVLADRGLSRLLGSDWPRTLEELEALKHR
jgi:formamidopyrimidine-DNA glycosylase